MVIPVQNKVMDIRPKTGYRLPIGYRIFPNILKPEA